MGTHRKGKVRIQNETGQRILSVSVGHKYSDDYKNKQDWEGPIANKASTPSGKDMTVDYTTGAFTTGRDWWTVSWVTEDGVTHITDPDNMRGFVDFIENVGGKIAAPLATLAIALAAAPEPVVSKVTAAAVIVTSLTIAGLTNSEGTSGFKQHILRSDDKLTTIVLRKSEVEWKSPSGNSTTGTTVLKA